MLVYLSSGKCYTYINVSCVALCECVSASVWCPVVLEHFVCGMFVDDIFKFIFIQLVCVDLFTWHVCKCFYLFF